MSWAADYIGLPYEAGGQGPLAFDCMGFFRMVQGRHFARDVPAIIAPDYTDEAALVDLFRHHAERRRWVRVPVPRHGDAVIIHRPLHIGVWLDDDGGSVLHCSRQGGVIFTRAASWRLSGFGRREYFRYEGAA